MKIFSILLVVVLISVLSIVFLTSCNSFLKHKDEIKTIGHEVVDEQVDSIASRIEKENEKKTDLTSMK